MAKTAAAKSTTGEGGGRAKAERAAAPRTAASKPPEKAAPASVSTVTVTDNATGASFDLPVMGGTIGPRVIDIRRLYGDHGLFTYDPGFTSTAACESKITYIDGEEGVLL